MTDHLWAGTTPFSHWAVTLGQLAAVTERVTLLSCFANNLLRSPVEFAQAALALQRASGGRFEAGLGAGWSQRGDRGHRRLLPAAGGPGGALRRSRPGGPGAVRDRAVLVRRRALPVEVPVLGPAVEQAPPIVVSVGGPRTIREIAPLADRVELAFNAAATRGGDQGLSRMAELGRAHLDDLVEQARRAAPDVPRGIFLTVACGDDDLVDRLDRSGALGIPGLAGPPDRVAATLLELVDDRIDRVQLTPATSATLPLLAEHLPLAHRS